MGSPYRSGFSAGLVAQQKLFDFGQTLNGVRAAESTARRQREETGIVRYQVDTEALRAFYDCAKNRTQKEEWKKLVDEAALVAREVTRFVKTGQRSVVDRYLAEAQKEEALTAAADYEQRQQSASQRIAVLTGLKPDESQCITLPEDASTGYPSGESPYLSTAKQDLEAAKARLDQTKAFNYPVLVGVGSFGYLQDARVVPKQDYALGAGLILPLFEGGRISAQVDRAAAAVTEKESEVSATQQRLDDLNTQLDQSIGSAHVRMDHLNTEATLARDGFAIAKKRYLAFQGTLIDVREALRNLSRTETDLIRARSEFLQSRGLKELLNGAAGKLAEH